MRCTYGFLAGLGVSALALFGPVARGQAQTTAAANPRTLQIGLMSSLFRGVPAPLANVVIQPFAEMMENQAGVRGKVATVGTPLELARQLNEDLVQVGVFHGFEFAWARQKYPQLEPLVIAVNQQRHLHAYLVVRKDGEANGLNDLRGKALALPTGSREHVLLFYERLLKGQGQEPYQFFAKVTTPPNTEDALDDVVDELGDATLVDGVALQCYKQRKPRRFARLKVLQESPTCPAAVVAYRPGALDEALVRRLRGALLNANQASVGRQLMILWRMTAFEPVPADYEENLANIAKLFPPPTTSAAVPSRRPAVAAAKP